MFACNGLLLVRGWCVGKRAIKNCEFAYLSLLYSRCTVPLWLQVTARGTEACPPVALDCEMCLLILVTMTWTILMRRYNFDLKVSSLLTNYIKYPRNINSLGENVHRCTVVGALMWLQSLATLKKLKSYFWIKNYKIWQVITKKKACGKRKQWKSDNLSSFYWVEWNTKMADMVHLRWLAKMLKTTQDILILSFISIKTK